MAALPHWRRRLDGWLRRLPWLRIGARDAQPFTVGNRRIYVLPTRFGLFVGLALAVLNLGSLNYNNNAALLLGFVVISLCNNALIAGHLSLLGLRIRTQSAAPVFAGQTLQLPVVLESAKADARPLLLEHGQAACTLTLGQGETRAVLPIAAARRGWQHIDRITISTRHPLGLARAWCHLNLQERVLVYPAPRGKPLPMQTAAADGGTGRSARDRSDQPHHLREYRSGDARKQIAWKASARTGNLQVREYERASADELLLDWRELPHLDQEARISQLALWVLEAERRQRRYALHLPGARIDPDSGAEHRHRCLQALALMPHG